MKKIMMSAAIALFAVSAFAQPTVTPPDHGRSDEYNKYDLNQDGKLSGEERAARKAERKAEAASRRADRDDDGVLNGSAGDNNTHGKDVSSIAKGTQLEGREKGKAVSEAARSNARNGARIHDAGSQRPTNAGRPANTGRPANAGRSAGRGK
jgi:hypothetical protein